MWGGLLEPPSRYRSAISTRFEITSSPLVTFNFKTFPKHRRTQFLNFLAQIWETRVWRQEVSVDFEKKNLKIWFFQFFLKQIILFLFEIEFYVKNAFFRGIACWNSSKITKFGNFHSFLAIFDRFLIFANFFVIFGKKFLKRGQMSWNWCQLLGKHDFWAKICSRAKIDRGGSWSPPPVLARPLRRQSY